VHGQTKSRLPMPRSENGLLARSRRSTCEGECPRSIPPVPLFAACGNPAGFRAFPVVRRSVRFIGRLPMNGSQPSTVTRASSSEKRQRVHKVDTRWDGIEHASLLAAAQTTGLTKGGYIRALVLGCPGPRAQRAPSVNAQALAQATAALHKVGSNLNQIARVLNAGGNHVTTKECLSALHEVRVVLACILEITGRGARP
jgi:hypothetical protein